MTEGLFHKPLSLTKMRSVLVLLLCCFGAGVQADQTCALRSSVTQIALVANPPLFQNVL